MKSNIKSQSAASIKQWSTVKHVKTIDNFSFEKEATVVANRKDHFIYF